MSETERQNDSETEIVAVTKHGQATIPKELRKRFGIDTPGKVLIHEEEGKIVVEPLPSVEEMQGVHAGRYEKGETLEHLREMRDKDKQLERERDQRLEGRTQ